MVLVVQNDARVPLGLLAAQLARRGEPFQLLRPDQGEGFPDPAVARAVVVLGGYMGVHDEARYPFLRPLKVWLDRLLAAQVPLLGICLGGQLLAEVLGAPVRSGCRGERGCRTLSLTPAGLADPLFQGLPETFPAFQWHNDSFDIPAGALHLAASPDCPGQAFRSGNAWGLQFHPEVDAGIAAAWAQATGAGPDVVEEFRTQETVLQDLSARLLDNFLALSSPVPNLLPSIQLPRG